MEKEFLGDFEILSELGRGPLGAVYLADHRFLKKRFLLKVLPPELMEDSSFVERFEKEVAKLSKLNHINLVPLHNISEARGVFFLVTDYISDNEGKSKNLAEYLGSLKKRLSEEEIISILKQVAYALDYLHSQKFDQKELYHGSLKLNNILVGKKEDNLIRTYLSDAGLLPIIGAGRMLTKTYQTLSYGLGLDSILTPFGSDTLYTSDSGHEKNDAKLHFSMMQSYAFLSPEQKSGLIDKKMGVKTDVYAFGILAYFLLMGYLPEGFFKMPSESESNFENNWDLLIKKCLHQNPQERPLSLLDLLEKITTSRTTSKELFELEESIERVTTESEEPVKASFGYQKPLYTRSESEKPFKGYDKTPSMNDKEPKFMNKESEIERRLKSFTPPAPVQAMHYREREKTSVMVEEEEDIEKKPVIAPSVLHKYEYEEDPGAIFNAPKVVVPYKAKEKEIKNVEPMLTEMVVIKEGEYYRGSNIGARDEKPRHKIFLSNYAIDMHAVTNEQYVRFLEVMGGEKDGNNNDMILLKESRIKRIGGKLSIESGYAKHPVVGVSWYGAKAYANWVGKRLPTEAEWEIAASAGKEDCIYPTGADIERSQANFFSSDTTLVMSYRPNLIGLYDVAGNVYEWCEDWYGYNYYEHSSQEPSNPKGPPQGVYRVLRGGCWKSLKEDLRVSHRHRNNPGSLNRTYGFRCAADVA